MQHDTGVVHQSSQFNRTHVIGPIPSNGSSIASPNALDLLSGVPWMSVREPVRACPKLRNNYQIRILFHNLSNELMRLHWILAFWCLESIWCQFMMKMALNWRWRVVEWRSQNPVVAQSRMQASVWPLKSCRDCSQWCPAYFQLRWTLLHRRRRCSM